MVVAHVFEVLFLIFLVLGIAASFLLNNSVLQTATIFTFGIMSAVLHKIKKADLNFPYVLLVIGFVIGYLVASKSGQRLLMLTIFFVGVVAGLFLKKIVKRHLQTKK